MKDTWKIQGPTWPSDAETRSQRFEAHSPHVSIFAFQICWTVIFHKITIILDFFSHL